MPEESIYTAPKADLTTGTANELEMMFFPTSQKKLIILFLATFGIYTVYWFYKNWKLQQGKMEKKIIPILRSIFYVFFTHSLFRRVEQAAIEKEISKTWSANLLATILIFLTIVSNVLDRLSGKTESCWNIGLRKLGNIICSLHPYLYGSGSSE